MLSGLSAALIVTLLAGVTIILWQLKRTQASQLMALQNAYAADMNLAQAAAEMSAKYHGATLEQLAYAWILAHPSRPLPVIGTNKRERIASAAQAAAIALDREDWYALWVAAKGHGIP